MEDYLSIKPELNKKIVENCEKLWKVVAYNRDGHVYRLKTNRIL